MTEPVALARVFAQSDARFFAAHADRKAHIRKPYAGECEQEFRTLGGHDWNRRRILLTRVDYERKPLPDNKIMKVPFLTFADESIEDRDDILLPIIDEIMQDAKARISH